MKISEAAKLTGLSTSNIRFYEKKGLLAPVRESESQYRDYSMEDIEQLKWIILCRKMNISVDTIFSLKNGKVPMETILKRQEEELLAQKEMLQGSIDLCRKIRAEKDLEHIDVDCYLNYVSEEEERGRRFAQVDELLEDFADFVRIEPFWSDPYVGKFFKNLRTRRVITWIVLLICMLMPAISIIFKYIEEDSVSVVVWIFWGVWYICMILAFLYFRKIRKRAL